MTDTARAVAHEIGSCSKCQRGRVWLAQGASAPCIYCDGKGNIKFDINRATAIIQSALSAAVAGEREACAKLLEWKASREDGGAKKEPGTTSGAMSAWAAEVLNDCAAAIRSRNTEDAKS